MATSSSIAARLLLLAGVLGTAACNSQSPETLIAQARQYVHQGEHKAAVIQLKNALQQTPGNAEARLLLATAHNGTGDGPAAEKEARIAAQGGIPTERYLPVIAQALMLQGQPGKILDELDRSRSGSALALTLRGDALLALKQAEPARQAYAKALQLEAGRQAATVGMARYHAMQSDLASATALVAGLRRVAPDNVDALLLAAELANSKGDKPEALAAYDRIIALAPAAVDARIRKAQLLIEKKDYPGAQAELTQAGRYAPGNPSARHMQGLLEFNQGHYKAALEKTQAVLSTYPDHWPTVLLAGTVQTKLGSLPQAEEHFRRYVEAKPDEAGPRRLLAGTLIGTRQGKEALAVLVPLLAQQKDAAAFELAGKAALALGERDRAAGFFEQSVAIDPARTDARVSLGLSRIEQGDHARGFAELEAADGQDPKGQAGMALAQAALQRRDYDRALAATVSLLRKTGPTPVAMQLTGEAYLGKRQTGPARASFERALALAPGYFPAVASLVALDLGDGNMAAAGKRLSAFQTANPTSVPAMNALANLAALDHRVDDATRWLERAHEAQPDATQPVIQLTAQYLRTKQKDKALTLIRNAQSAQPLDNDLLDMLGQAQLAAGDIAGAVETYDRLARRAPRAPLAFLRLAGLHQLMKNDAAAAAALKKALQLQPDSLEAQAMLLQVLKRQQKPEQMRALFRQIQGQRANAHAGHTLEGDWLTGQKQYRAALQAYERAWALRPTRELAVRRYMMHLAQGEQKQAFLHLTGWRAKHPDDMAMNAYLAQAYTDTGQSKLAIALWEEVHGKMAPTAASLASLARSYYQEQDLRALATAEQAYKLDNKNAVVADVLGWTLVNHGQTVRGVALLRQAVAAAPELREARYHLAYGLKQAGDLVQARTALNILLAEHKEIAGDQRVRNLIAELN